jgi:uncharacterized membrane protein SpoIIM required for sporulation
MVLETLIGVKAAEKKPWNLLFLGFLYSSIAIILSLIIFKSEASMVMVFLTVLASVPLVYNTIRLEEKKEGMKERLLIKEHGKALSVFVFLFLGFLIAFVAFYVFMPHDLVQSVFDTQIRTIEEINARINNIQLSGSVIEQSNFFFGILANNLKVLFFCVFFSFFYGAGAIFILTWNASVISAAIGNTIRNNLGSVFGIHYFTAFSFGVMKYMTHGIFEIVAYFMGGLAGGIISVAVIRHEVHTDKFKKIVKDSFDLIFLSLIILIIAGLIEVYVTPVLF